MSKRTTHTFRILAIAIPMAWIPTKNAASEPPSKNEEARKSYREFLGSSSAVDSPHLFSRGLDGLALKGVDEVKKDPSRVKMFERILRNQESRTPQPNADIFLSRTPILAEVRFSEDPDTAQVFFWNEVALNITANDHTEAPADLNITSRAFEQVGPARTSRAMAIVHIAIFEAINTIQKKFKSYKDLQPNILSKAGFTKDTPEAQFSVRRAIAHSAYRSLVTLYPEKIDYLTTIMVANVTSLNDAPNPAAAGKAVGEAAASLVLATRNGDHSSVDDPTAPTTTDTPLTRWVRDPLNANPTVALGERWREVTPFIFADSNELFKLRPKGPPAIGSTEYTAAFEEVKNYGGDYEAGNIDPPGLADRRPLKPDAGKKRTDEQTFIGKFWAYDATPLLCAPPRLYNMIATSIALKEKKDEFKNALILARYLALTNTAMAEAGIGAWEAKFYYNYPRPVTAIRATQVGNDLPWKFWAPLGAPVSNGPKGRVNFSPPFPAYPSGHAVFGGAFFQVLRRYFGGEVGFTFVSDEYNGFTKDPGETTVRPLKPRTFTSFTEAEKENGQSRIYLGIHWQFDSVDGIKQGQEIGDHVFSNAFNQL